MVPCGRYRGCVGMGLGWGVPDLRYRSGESTIITVVGVRGCDGGVNECMLGCGREA